jgi:hypothetical protein
MPVPSTALPYIAMFGPTDYTSHSYDSSSIPNFGTRPALGPTQPLIHRIPETKRLGRENDYARPSNTEAKNS